MKLNCALNCAIIAIALNLLLPFVLSKLATQETNTCTCKDNSKSLKDQIMNMMVHHKNTPVSSSLIVGGIVFLSCLIEDKVKIVERLNNLF